MHSNGDYSVKAKGQDFYKAINTITKFRETPSIGSIVLELPIFLLVEEVGFYYSHRLLHRPLLYRTIHKLHHDWVSPVGLAALYSHPVEHLLSNLVPVALGEGRAGGPDNES